MRDAEVPNLLRVLRALRVLRVLNVKGDTESNVWKRLQASLTDPWLALGNKISVCMCRGRTNGLP